MLIQRPWASPAQPSTTHRGVTQRQALQVFVTQKDHSSHSSSLFLSDSLFSRQASIENLTTPFMAALTVKMNRQERKTPLSLTTAITRFLNRDFQISVLELDARLCLFTNRAEFLLCRVTVIRLHVRLHLSI